ncbi:hypothetical protein [Victivallis lenta]|uniref:hypothetical protein n=1 Tax=Victivallis lenta TaxID=2606640 RepID=UPI0012B3E601|nr:hypothetical protein [Victivallis lenta]
MQKKLSGTDGIRDKANRYPKCEISAIGFVLASLRVNHRIGMLRPAASRGRTIVFL